MTSDFSTCWPSLPSRGVHSLNGGTIAFQQNSKVPEVGRSQRPRIDRGKKEAIQSMFFQ